MAQADGTFGFFHLGEATAWNDAEVCIGDSVSVTTTPEQWAFAALFPLHDDPVLRRPDGCALLIRIEAIVERGEVGISVVEPSLREFIAPEIRGSSGVGMTLFEVSLNWPPPGSWLVIRNCAAGGVASKIQIHSLRTFLARRPPIHSASAALPGTALDGNVPSHPPPVEAIGSAVNFVAGGVEVFDTPESLAINRARMEHLATLGIPLEGKSVLDVGCGVGHLSVFFAERGCRVVCLDARAENLERLTTFYPGREIRLASVECDSLEQFGRFDIVFCYGLIYHTENPIAALRNMASCCDELLLLETVVTDHPKPIVQLVDEPAAINNQAVYGLGSRPSPAFIAMALSRMGFPFVYTSRTAPDHRDFHFQWRSDGEWRRDDHLLRCVFVASRTQLHNPQLSPLLETGIPGGAAKDSQALAKPDIEIWIDVGAHHGEKTLDAARQNSALRVYAFEPNLAAASRLMGVLSNYVVLPVAVAEQDGSAPFYLNGYDAASSLLPFAREGLDRWIGAEALRDAATVTVPTMRLDTFLDRMGIRKVDYLKIDAQGADLAVIRSAGERLKDIARISLEVQTTPFELYSGASRKEDVLQFLTAAGFQLTEVEAQSFDQEENLTFVRCV
jgi:FkbM family methyltransferase